LQFFTGTNLFGHEILENRISSFFSDELVLGSYLARLFPLFFALFVAKKNKHLFEVFAIFILFLLVDVLIFIAGERASFFFLNLSTVFIILFITQYKWLRLAVFVLSLFVITLLTFNNPKLYDRYIQSPIQSMGFDNKNSKKQMFTSEHDSVIRTGWKMFLDKPILGHGPKMYRIKCKDSKYATGITPCHTHPHNFYIQLLAETGMAGFSFLAGLFFYFCYLIIRHILEYFKNSRFLFNDYQICLLAGLLITIWPLTTNGNFFTNHLMLFYSLQMGFFRKNI
jgi:O-antigen ligase